MIAYAPIVFLLEFIVSYLLNAGSIAILTKKSLNATILSGITNICTWASLIVVVKITDWNVWMIISASLGDMMGDYLVAERWPDWLWQRLNKPRKKKYLKRSPVTTA